ncbi:MAG: response regulator [Bacteroidales bacterium]
MNDIDNTEAEMIKQEEAIIRAAHKLKPLKIVLAEYSHSGLRILPRFLEDLNHEVIFADNGKEVVDVFLSMIDIDLIIMDIQMPIMDGFTATQVIREFDKEIIIILLSATPIAEVEKHAIEVGIVINGYLQKPMNIVELSALLIKYFGK